jgi:hypothetical protein
MHRLGSIVALILSGVVIASAERASAEQASVNLATALARVVERVEDFYERAQRLLVTEKVHIQPLGTSLTADGFGRRLTFEMRIERDEAAAGVVPKAVVIRRLLLANGRAPRKQDEPECMDPRSTDDDPLTMLLPVHREEFSFTMDRDSKLNGRVVNVINFQSRHTPKGRTVAGTWKEECVSIPLDGFLRGSIRIDAESGDVLRIEQRLIGPVDIPSPREGPFNDGRWRTLERWDQYINYKQVPFKDPDETLLVPASIESLSIFRGSGTSRVRTTQMYSDYKRLVTESRIVQ